MAERKSESGKRRVRMGRPPMPSDQVRSNRVVTFVTNQELTELEQVALEEETSLSGVVHEMLLRGLESRDGWVPTRQKPKS